MDPPMLALRRRMRGPLAGGLRLYGGAAAALHLGHRNSTGFDFVAAADVVVEGFAASLPWLKGARINWRQGMIDAVMESEGRSGSIRPIAVTQMEVGPLVFDPRNPAASNDLCDLAAMLRVLPDWSARAAEIVSAAGFGVVSVRAAIASPPDGETADIPLVDRDVPAAAAVRPPDGLESPEGDILLNGLGHDPRTDERRWRGTVIPPVHLPLSTTPEYERAGSRIWWRWPPWTIVRNGPQFVPQVMDIGNDEALRLMLVDVPRGIRRLQMPVGARFPEVRRLFGQSDSDC